MRRIYLKTITPENNDVSYQDVGFVALRSLLRKQSPLLGLSFEVNDADTVTATHHLYNLTENENGVEWIERYPLRPNIVTVMTPCERSKAITDPFTLPDKSIAATMPTLPDNVDQYFFSDAEQQALLSPIQDCFSRNGVDFFQDKDPHIVNSILRTLFSAGFITHTAWHNNLALLVKNQNKLEDVASTLFALHEVGLLTQNTFTAVVSHEKPWACASALRTLTHPKHTRKITEKIEKILAVPFRKAGHVDDDLFFGFPAPLKTVWEKSLNTVMSHPFPEIASEIILLLMHSFKLKPESTMLDAIARIQDKSTLNFLSKILFWMLQKHLLNADNCLALLKQTENPVQFQHIFYTINHKLRNCNLTLTQPLFDAIIFSEDPRLLVTVLSHYRELIKKQFVARQTTPTELIEEEKIFCDEQIIPVVALFEHLAKAGLATRKNLNVYDTHKNKKALAKFPGELMHSGVAITQTIFDALCAYPDLTDKHVIETLMLTPIGRNELRNHVTKESGNFFFGNAPIPTESLAFVVEHKTVYAWLSITTEEDLKQKARSIIDAVESKIAPDVSRIEATKRALFDQFVRNQSRLFSLRREHGVAPRAAATGEREHSEAVTPMLQQVVYGNERDKADSVKTALDAAITDPNRDKLCTLLCGISTVTDYSGRTITDTLFKAALRAGDVDMCQMLILYFDRILDGKKELEIQFSEVFPDGVEAHDADQQQNAFNFYAILLAIVKASPADLNVALNKTGAQFTESDEARAKPNSALSLTEALNRFREQFTQLSHQEKIFNPHHLLRAFALYNALWDQCERNRSDPGYKKRDLFWRQIIGYIQRFMPACYAQVFSQGLCYLVKVDQFDSWRPEALRRALKLRCDNFSYFPLSLDSHSGLGFNFAIYDGGCAALGARRRANRRRLADFFKTFCRANTSGFQRIMLRVRLQQRAQPDERHCVTQ